MNIFIFPTGGWGAAIEIILAYLKRLKVLDQVVVIKRSKTCHYQVVWPKNFKGEFERL